MGNSQYRRQQYVTYHGYPAVWGLLFISSAGNMAAKGLPVIMNTTMHPSLFIVLFAVIASF